jgi:glycerol-3-phosphate acyltransferase PlsX
MKNDSALRFVGNVEGRDIFRGTCDVVVCEGFVGNVCLKLMEGLAEGLFKTMFQVLAKNKPELTGEFQAGIKSVREQFDFNEYGGAPLLGVNGICIICHGASSYRAIVNAIRVAKESAEAKINDRIIDRIQKWQGSLHG